jgi:hypothetical protein
MTMFIDKSKAIHAVVDAAQPPTSSPPTNAELLPEPSVNVELAIARMFIENAYTQRKAAHEDKRAAEGSMIAAQKDQIAKMRAAAEERFEAARLEAFGKIAEGAAGVAGGLAGIGALGIEHNPKEWDDSMTSGGKLGSGLLSLGAAGHKENAENLDADGKAAEMQQTVAKHEFDDADDAIKEAREHARNALDFLREYESTQAKTMASALKA